MNNHDQDLFDICKNRHRGVPESIAANAKAAFGKSAQRFKILALLKDNPMTCQEIEERLKMDRSSASARMSELKRAGLIQRVGTRNTRSGCAAGVWEALK